MRTDLQRRLADSVVLEAELSGVVKAMFGPPTF